MALKICPTHWLQCYQAIKGCGLGHLIAENPSTIIERIKKKMNGQKLERKDYDPLYDLNNLIVGRFILEHGDNLLKVTQDYCPLCEIESEELESNNPTEYLNEALELVNQFCMAHSLQG
jgi:hypothetical protein